MNELDIITDRLDDMAEFIDNKSACSEAVRYLRALKPKVPTFVAYWYEQHINIGISDLILNLIEPMDGLDRDSDSAKVFQWFKLLSQDNPNHYEDDLAVITLTRMYLFGYEVQEWN